MTPGTAILSGTIGELVTRDLARDRATYGSLGGTFLGPVFQGGRLVAGRDAAQARYDEAVARFRRAVENAFRDVADQLAAVRGAREVRAAQEQLAQERAALIAKNEQARARVEAMISRLKALEQHG